MVAVLAVLRLLEDGHEVVGADNLSAYYDIKLKRARLERLAHPRFVQAELDLVDAGATRGLFER